MDALHITGGARLHGTVHASGSKNASLPMMAASILADEPVRLVGAPRIADVATLASLLEHLGMRVTRVNQDDPVSLGTNTLRLETVLAKTTAKTTRAPYRLASHTRAAFCVLGPLLARRGRAVVSLPGGCNIGDRPVDLHLAGLAALGADLALRGGYVIARAKQLRGADIDLHGACGPTVTGTANVLCAATLARGKSVIRGAAKEPEIVNLGELLRAMGAMILGLGTDTLEVTGSPSLRGATHRVIPDRIEAGTLLIAAAMTLGDVTVTGVCPDQMTSILETLDHAGGSLQVTHDGIRLRASRRPRPIRLAAIPYPGFPTDLQPQLTALAALADGNSTITDTVFPQRMLHLGELRRMGARLRQSGASALVVGRERLSGATVTAGDLRAGAALALTALAAEGRTVLRGARHIDRGYEDFAGKLRALGASVRGGDQHADARDTPPTVHLSAMD